MLVVVAVMPASRADDVAWLATVSTRTEAPELPGAGQIEDVLSAVDSDAPPSLESWSVRRQTIRDQWMRFLGPMPAPRPSVQLEVVRSDQVSGITRQLVRYEGEPGLFVEAYLLIPATAGQPTDHRFPAIVAFHPTTDLSIDEIAGVRGREEKFSGLKLAQRGFVVFCPRCFLWQSVASFDDAVARHRERHPETTGMGKMLYDATRAVDVVASLPIVDASRIGAFGHSLGAKEVLYLAAFDERIRAAVASEGGLGLRSTNWDAPWYLGDAIHDPQFALNHHELLALIAPRPFLVIGGESGPGAADGERSRVLINAALPAWELYGQPVRLGFLNHHQGHPLPDGAFEKAADWLRVYVSRN